MNLPGDDAVSRVDGIGRAALSWAALVTVLALSPAAISISTAHALEEAPADSSAPVEPTDDPLVVVVGEDSPIRGLELATLRLAYLGELSDLHELVMGAGSGGGAPITLLLYAPEEDRFLRVVAHRTYLQYRRYWTRRVLAGDSMLAPLRVHYLHELRLRLQRDRQALGFARYSDAQRLVAQGLRILPLDGLVPGDVEYPLP